ncbi:MAG: glycosyltransferase [Novosphingobium sp.]
MNRAAESHSPGQVHFVWTRAIDGVPMAGRPNVARQVRSAFLSQGYAISESIIQPLSGSQGAGRLIEAGFRLLGGLLTGRPLPLQCLLFGAKREASRVLAELPPGCELVYLDGVRCLRVLEQLRHLRPDLAIVTDLDDLMSRRMDLLLRLDQPPSMGYLAGAMPAAVGRLLAMPILARLLLRYEAASLRQAERAIAEHSDCVVLISSADAAVLRGRVPSADVRSISVAATRPVSARRAMQPPYRFVFIGTDALRQNQLTIDALIALWRKRRVKTPLVIYGEQHRAYDLPPMVTMPGYADCLDQVHDGHSVLLTPSYVAGGIKTKVIEAFAYGTPVAGNAVTFEAIAIGPDYPLLFETEEHLAALLDAPERFAEVFASAIDHGLAIVDEYHDPARINAAWAKVAQSAVRRHGQKRGGVAADYAPGALAAEGKRS